jgi:branched-subunit amino acid aminotransferase/4-amino-4-deoxychorismate lyase
MAAIKRKEREERRRIEREARKALGASKPWNRCKTDADKFRMRYRMDAEFREKEKKRISEKKKQVPLWYANQLLGGSSKQHYPVELLLAKQLEKQINNLIKEKS